MPRKVKTFWGIYVVIIHTSTQRNIIIYLFCTLYNQPTQLYKMTSKENFKLTGLKLKKKTFNANGQSAIDCGSLWQNFMSEAVADKITGKLSQDIYAVYFDYDGDHTQPYSFFIGCKVSDAADTPDGLDSMNIPAQNYTVITAKGKMPDCVANAWQEIWKSDIDRAYGYDFEVYNELSADWGNAQVDIYLSVK